MSRLYDISAAVERGAKGPAEALQREVLRDLLAVNSRRGVTLTLSDRTRMAPTQLSPWADRPEVPGGTATADGFTLRAPTGPYAKRRQPIHGRGEHPTGQALLVRWECSRGPGRNYAMVTQPLLKDLNLEGMREWLLPYGLAAIHPPDIDASTWRPGEAAMLIVLPVWDAPLWRWTPDFLDFGQGVEG